MDTENENFCVICKYVKNWDSQSGDDALCTVQKRGIANICKISSETRKDGLHKQIEKEKAISVHEKCRLRYIKTNISGPETKKRRLTESSDYPSSSDESETKNYEFDFEKHCVICRKKIHHTHNFSVLSTDEAKQSVINYLTNDETLNSVKKL